MAILGTLIAERLTKPLLRALQEHDQGSRRSSKPPLAGGKPGKLSNGGSSEAVDMKSIRRLFDQVRTPQYAGKPVVEIEGLAPPQPGLCT